MPKLRLVDEFEAIGTHWFIELEYEPSAILKAAINNLIENFDRTYSRFREDSMVTMMAQAAGEYALPEDALPMIETYQRCYNATNGAMTPLIGQVMSDAGYDAAYSLKPGRLVPPPAWDEIITLTDSTLSLAEPILFDFGAIGKGYLVDLIAQLLTNYGQANYLINAGGDIRYQGTEAVTIGLEDPAQPGKLIAAAQLLPGRSLCGSAGNRRTWGRFHHIINPFTLESPRNIQAIWAIADSTRIADAITTALNFTSPQQLRFELEDDFEYFMIMVDGQIKRSEAFPLRTIEHNDIRGR